MCGTITGPYTRGRPRALRCATPSDYISLARVPERSNSRARLARPRAADWFYPVCAPPPVHPRSRCRGWLGGCTWLQCSVVTVRQENEGVRGVGSRAVELAEDVSCTDVPEREREGERGEGEEKYCERKTDRGRERENG